MTIVYILLPFSLFLAMTAGLAFRWAVNNKQFDDVDSPPIRMLNDAPLYKEPDMNSESGEAK